jgi:hypothetical protein
VHVPSLPVTSQAWHWSPHAVLQQKPSTQLPLVHAAFDVHALAFASSGVHMALLQNALDAQSVADVQDVTHAPFSHAQGAQVAPAVVVQVPCPLHAWVATPPVWQTAPMPHDVPVG